MVASCVLFLVVVLKRFTLAILRHDSVRHCDVLVGRHGFVSAESPEVLKDSQQLLNQFSMPNPLAIDSDYLFCWADARGVSRSRVVT
jgi:hypothetical protein